MLFCNISLEMLQMIFMETIFLSVSVKDIRIFGSARIMRISVMGRYGARAHNALYEQCGYMQPRTLVNSIQLVSHLAR